MTILELVLCSACTPARAELAVPDRQRVLVLGDSITQAGDYVTYLDAYFFTRHPTKQIELLAIGLASETVSGLSEADHPFPRPDLHERLTRALDLTQPGRVTACYGMNDGIYHPFSEERFVAYRQGIERLAAACRQRNLPLTILTPPPFDAEAPGIRDKVVGPDHPEFGYKAPYRRYDDVLARYREWLLARPADPKENTGDPHGLTLDFLQKRRAGAPDFHLARDGIHPDATGHLLIALSLLRAWNGPEPLPASRLQARRDPAGESWKAIWKTPLPMPRDPRWDADSLQTLKFHEIFNRSAVAIDGLPPGRWEIREGDTRIGEWDSPALKNGVDLMASSQISPHAKAAGLLPPIQKRRQLLGDAWRQHVGHKRPGIGPAPSVEEAETQAELLESEIRQASGPVEIELTLIPVRP